MLPIESPFKTYTGLDGKPLDNGYVYLGEAGQDPIAHPIAVYWDAAGTIPAAQPLRTVNGYISNSGTPANVFVGSAYSELVKNSKLQTVFYAANSTDFDFGSILTGVNGADNVKHGGESLGTILKNSVGKVVSSIAAIRALDTARFTQAFATGYYTAGDGGGGAYYFDSTDSTSPDNGGTVLAVTGGRWKLVRGALVSPRNFGAKGDYAADDTDALNRWTAYLLGGNAATNQHTGYGAAGTYKVTGSGWVINIGDYMPPLITDGGEQFIIKGTIPVLVTFNAPNGSGQLPTCEWGGVKIDGVTNTGTNEGVRVTGACFFTLKGWHFYRLGIAARLYNLAAGSFTEGVVLEDAYFDTSVTTCLRYSRGAGNDSFRSSGLYNCKINLGATAGPAVIVDSGCVPYMAPMDVTLWNFNPNGTFIQNNSSQMPVVGDITTETQGSDSNKLTLADPAGGYVFLHGTIIAWNYLSSKLVKGHMLQTREFFNAPDIAQMFMPDNSSGSIVSTGVGQTFSLPYTPGVNKPFQQNSATLTVCVTAPNGYYWQGVFLVMSGATDNIVNATSLVDGIVNNADLIGAMVVSQGNAYNVIISNANTPVGTRCSYSFQYLHGLIPQ